MDDDIITLTTDYQELLNDVVYRMKTEEHNRRHLEHTVAKVTAALDGCNDHLDETYFVGDPRGADDKEHIA